MSSNSERIAEHNQRIREAIETAETLPEYDTEVADTIVARTITNYSSDRITSIGASAFAGCSSLKTVNCPNVLSIGTRSFSQSGITRLEFPKLTTIGGDACTYCYSLTYVDFWNVASLATWTLANCTGLVTLILRKTDGICTLKATNALNDTPIADGTGYIYVPAALVDSYKSATNWSTFADQFRAIEDYPDIVGGLI